MRRCVPLVAVLLAACMLLPCPAEAYPLYESEDREIPRLPFYIKRRQPDGARLPLAYVDLRLIDRPWMTLPQEEDKRLDTEIRRLIPGRELDRYSYAVFDFSDPDNPRWAEHRANVGQMPGSVGKIVIGLALFQALADTWPDVNDRMRVLSDTVVTADDFIIKDSHDVPYVADGRIGWRPLKIGDSGNLWTFLDWMMSASSNAAASMVLKQAMLIQRFGRDYPVDAATAKAAFTKTSRKERSTWLNKTIVAPLARSGLDPQRIRQGGFFTWKGKQMAPSQGSNSTARELAKFMLYMEQGKLVDEFSSRELKRLLYVTQKRIRYASSPALNSAAVYFKSGSMYGCRPEPGFVCGKYKGNRINMLNSVAVVESPALNPKVRYICVILSNVLKKNSAVQHQSLGTYIHRIIERMNP